MIVDFLFFNFSLQLKFFFSFFFFFSFGKKREIGGGFCFEGLKVELMGKEGG